MREEWDSFRDWTKVKSFLLVFVMVVATLAVMLPLTAPVASAVLHLGSTSAEDGGTDLDQTGTGDNLVYWYDTLDHDMNVPYVVETGWELRIPALNFQFNPATEYEIEIQNVSVNITVQSGAKLTIESNGPMSPTRTYFWFSPSSGFWQGIYVEPGGEVVFQDVWMQGADKALTLSPGSIVGGSGIQIAKFQDYGTYGVWMDGAVGVTNMHTTVDFEDGLNSGTGLMVTNGNLNLSNGNFLGHGPWKECMYVGNSFVTIQDTQFNVDGQDGNALRVEKNLVPNSTQVSVDQTVENLFTGGPADGYYVWAKGASPHLADCSFDESGGARSIMASDGFGIPSHAYLLNPNPFGTFNQSRINITSDSTVAIQWYVDVYVQDPNFNPIPDSTVDIITTPSWPDTMQTDAQGMATGFWVTDRILHEFSVDHFNPFNITAENNSMIGYAIPEAMVTNPGTVVVITVGFLPYPNSPPTVLWLSTPVGIQSGPVTINFGLDDADPGDNGFLSIDVYFSTDNSNWFPATMGPGSDPTSGLYINTSYYFVWDSANPNDLPGVYNTTVYIKIIPYDMIVSGTPALTGNFTVDNTVPSSNSPPIVSWLSTPVGVQSGNVTIEYLLHDPDPGDNGNLSVEVYFSTGNSTWYLATAGPGGDPTTGLYNNTLYQFIWDSNNPSDLHGIYNTTVYLKIIPYDLKGAGTPAQTGNFTVDNTVPPVNSPPVISWLPTPVGVQSGLVSIEYILIDPDPGDQGNLDVEVYFSTDNSTWNPATAGPGGDPTTGLYNNTLYQFVWDSKDPNDLPGIYNTTVYLKIIPYDLEGAGTPAQTDKFTLDNKAPVFPLPPMNVLARLSPVNLNDVELVWNASTDDGAGDNDVTGYTVYKSSSGVNGSYGFEAWIPATGSSSYIWIDVGAGDGDWNNYFYIIRANDTSGNEEQNTYKVGKFAHYLVDGWNLFSVPLIQVNTTMEYVLQTLEGNYLMVQGYHAGKSRPWKHWNRDKPKNMNDVIEIDHKSGYYIRMLVPDYLVVAGKVPTDTSVQMKAGWNLVGYPSPIQRTVTDALSSIAGMYNKVEFYNTTTDKEEGMAPLDYMYPGLGYWIHCTADCTWEVPF